MHKAQNVSLSGYWAIGVSARLHLYSNYLKAAIK